MEDKKRRFWPKAWEFFGEIFGELIITLLGFGTGLGILWLLGKEEIVKQVDFELIVLLGFAALAVVAVIVLAIVAAVKKKKKKSQAD